MSPIKVVLGKPCLLLVELEHQVTWVIKTLNIDLEATRIEMKLQLSELELQLSELEEIITEVYENSRICKERAKLFHDRYIHKKEFFPG